MKFTKLALAAAVAVMMPAMANAVEVLDEEGLGAVTGQDGIRVQMNLALNTTVAVHDLDGFAGATEEAAIVITGAGLNTNGATLIVDIDAGDTAAATATPTLNINVTIPNGTTVTTGAISVANSNRDVAALSTGGGNVGGNVWGTEATVGTIVESATITLGTTPLNIQLGNEPQGNMIRINTTIAGGLQIAGGSIHDVNSLGEMGADFITVIDNGGAGLTLDVGIDVVDGATDGLRITVNQLGSGTGIDARMERVYLGVDPGTPAGATAGYIGDVEVMGLTFAGTIDIVGK